MEVLTNLIVVIILQYMYVLKHHIVHLKLNTCYMPITSQSRWGKRFQFTVTMVAT